MTASRPSTASVPPWAVRADTVNPRTPGGWDGGTVTVSGTRTVRPAGTRAAAARVAPKPSSPSVVSRYVSSVASGLVSVTWYVVVPPRSADWEFGDRPMMCSAATYSGPSGMLVWIAWPKLLYVVASTVTPVLTARTSPGDTPATVPAAWNRLVWASVSGGGSQTTWAAVEVAAAGVTDAGSIANPAAGRLSVTATTTPDPPGLSTPVVPIGRQLSDSFSPAAARSDPPVVRTWPVSR